MCKFNYKNSNLNHNMYYSKDTKCSLQMKIRSCPGIWIYKIPLYISNALKGEGWIRNIPQGICFIFKYLHVYIYSVFLISLVIYYQSLALCPFCISFTCVTYFSRMILGTSFCAYVSDKNAAPVLLPWLTSPLSTRCAGSIL